MQCILLLAVLFSGYPTNTLKTRFFQPPKRWLLKAKGRNDTSPLQGIDIHPACHASAAMSLSRNDTSPLQGIDISICVDVRNPTIAARRIKHECGPHSTGKKSIDLVLTTDTKSMLFMFFLLSFFNHMFLPII
jgi:hypothetical protein